LFYEAHEIAIWTVRITEKINYTDTTFSQKINMIFDSTEIIVFHRDWVCMVWTEDLDRNLLGLQVSASMVGETSSFKISEK
jgi:hypothetical protein